ncbi:MAG: tetratricopeptide repeat protein [Candidatus Marinimicrobia bacterium]|nr:tetratricopeptide repeat protein [Candidatus Neomarinimicrobiota bacterium]
MIKYINMNRAAGALSAAILVILMAGCAATGEIPITTSSEEARAVFLEARQLAENLRPTEARALFDQAIAKDPDFAMAYLARAAAATSNKDFQEHLSRAVALAPNVSEGERLLIEAQQALAENKPLKALELREQVVAKYPNDKRAHNVLAFSYTGQDEDDKAIAEFEKAVAIDPDFAPPYNNLGYAYLANGDYEQAEEAFKNYIRLIPDEANPYDSMADLLTRMGRHEEAIEHFKKSAELNPTFGFSQRKIGLNQIYLGQYDEGRESIRQAIEMEPGPFGKVVDLEAIAFSYLFEGQPQQTLAEIGKAVELAAEANLPVRLALIHAGICYLHAELGNLAEAEQSLAACKEVVAGAEFTPAAMDFFADQALFNEAFIAAKRQDFETALAKADELKASIEAGADPEEIEVYHLLLGLIYLEKGEYTQALEHLAEVDQDDPFNVYQVARAESGTGNQEKANELYQKVARWNEVQSHSNNDLIRALGYALVRPKALAAIGE